MTVPNFFYLPSRRPFPNNAQASFDACGVKPYYLNLTEPEQTLTAHHLREAFWHAIPQYRTLEIDFPYSVNGDEFDDHREVVKLLEFVSSELWPDRPQSFPFYVFGYHTFHRLVVKLYLSGEAIDTSLLQAQKEAKFLALLGSLGLDEKEH